MQQKPTLASIAKAYGGISASTVSLALRDSPKIPEVTRNQIKKIAAELGYSPNRNLSRVMSEIRRRGNTHFIDTLAYIVPKSAPFEQRIYAGVRRRAETMGYRLNRFEIDDQAPDVETLERSLRARGIKGLILSPFGHAEAKLQLDWRHFAGVAIGYTLFDPILTRVARDLVHSVNHTFSLLVDRGYQRIGFAMQRSHEARLDYSNLAAFLLHEWRTPKHLRIPPLIVEDMNRENFSHWFNQHQPDIVVTMQHGIADWLREMGKQIPEDLGFFVLNSYAPESQTSGIYPAYEDLGACAVEQVSSLLERGEFGPSQSAKTLLVNGIWIEGNTIRK